MSFFKSSDKEPDYVGLLKDISSIELSNENVDIKTSAEKLYVLQKLKEKIEESGILKFDKVDAAHILIKYVYNILYTPQGSFPKSYYATLSEALNNAHGYMEFVKPYELLLASDISNLKNLAVEASKNEEQRRMSAMVGGHGTGFLRAAMLSIMLGLGAIGCNVPIDIAPLTIHNGAIEYRMDIDNLEHYMINEGAIIRTSELGKLRASEDRLLKRPDGGTENIKLNVYGFDNDTSPDIVAMKRANGAVAYLIINIKSKSYEKILKKFGSRIYRIEPGYKLNWRF